MMHKQSSGLLVGRIVVVIADPVTSPSYRRLTVVGQNRTDAERDGAPDTPDSVCAAREAYGPMRLARV
jgi:hypothetical protein